MAVAVIATDTWLSHLQFTGPRRQTDFGPIDGLFYGVVSGTGDATGGNISLNGNVSFDRKEDWIYILKNVSSSQTGDISPQEVFYVVATGPVIPTPTAVNNASFHVGGSAQGITNNSVTITNNLAGGDLPITDIPIFGDKKLAGPLSMIACAWGTNIDASVYQLSVYGWLVRYQSFFRNTNPAFG